MRRRVPTGALLGTAGVTLLEVLIGMTILALVTVTMTNLMLTGLTQVRSAGVHGEAATWVQAEMDYLRGLGYGHSCLAAGTRTITPTSTGCTSLQPPLPATFARATVRVEDNVLGRQGLKRVTIEVFRSPGKVFYRVATYATPFQ